MLRYGKVRVVSLKDADARRAEYSSYNCHVDFEFVDAVLGRSLPDSVKNDRSLFASDLTYSDGSIGNALSHMLQWELAVRHNCVMTISEDDCIFRRDFSDIHVKLIESLPDDWDIIYWGFNFDADVYLNIMPNVSPVVMKFSQDDVRKNVNGFRDMTVNPSLLRVSATCGLPSYSVSPKGASILLSNCFPLSNFNRIMQKMGINRGLDHGMGMVCPHINAYVSIPPLAIALNYKSASVANFQADDRPELSKNSQK